MSNGPKTNMNPRHTRPSGSYAARPKRGPSNGAGPDPRNFQNAQRNYERYIALARAEAQSGNTVAAENYYQHAEHYFRSMSTDPRVK